jgi:hypothetical protein
MLGSILSNVMGNMMRGAQPGEQAAGPQPTPGAPSAGMPGMNPAMQAGLEVLTGMFKTGAQAQSAHVAAVQDILNAYMKGATGKAS